MNNWTDRIVAATQEATGNQDGFVLLHGPHIPPAAWQYVKECLDTGWVSSAGAYVTKFEEQLAQITGCQRAIATVNGTAALEMCFRLAGVKADDEVICPALTFVATANAITHVGAIPHFVDVCPSRFGLCPNRLADRLNDIAQTSPTGVRNRETGRRIAAVCPMHCFGHPVDLDGILDVCNRYEIPLVEDAAESLGSTYRDRHTGNHGLLSAVSFNGNKILTTGGGGAILTNDPDLADRAKHLTTTGKVPHAWEFHHDEVAWNYRLPNINAALGVAQLEQLPKLLDAKRRLAQSYQAAFAEISGLSILSEPTDSRSNYWLNCILLEPDHADHRDTVLKALNDSNLQSRPLWRPMHYLPMFSGCPQGPLSITESLTSRAINIPSSAYLANNWVTNEGK